MGINCTGSIGLHEFELCIPNIAMSMNPPKPYPKIASSLVIYYESRFSFKISSVGVRGPYKITPSHASPTAQFGSDFASTKALIPNVPLYPNPNN